MDASQFFPMAIDLSGSLPELNLRVVWGMINMTMNPEMVNMPYGQLLAGAEHAEVGLGAGGQESFEEARVSGAGEAPVDQRTFARVLCPIKAALAGTWTKYPNIWILDLMMATILPLK
jgi:hypothetical protein